MTDRIWDRVDTSGGLDACWPWTGRHTISGYGVLPRNRDEKERYAHRVIYEMAHGELPSVVRHACDNPPCVNPLHLQGGSQSDNVADMWARKRGVVGSTCPWAILTEYQVSEIRQKYQRRAPGQRGNGPELAREFGVTERNVYAIINRKIWKEVA